MPIEKLLSTPSPTTLADKVNELVDGVNAAPTAALLTVPLPASGWTNEAPYTQTVGAAGVTEGMTPVVDVLLSDAPETARAELDAYLLLGRVDTGAGTVKATCYAGRPGTDLNIQLKVVE